MAGIGGTKSWVATMGVALLLAFVAVPALSGAASAATSPGVALPTSPSQWAYGGEGWSNNTVIVGNATLTWDAMFGWSVIWTVTPTAPGVTLVEEQRAFGISIRASYADPLRSVSYSYHGEETDAAFANLTNASTVYVSGLPVPALGLVNASATVRAGIDESISLSAHGVTRSASLNVNGFANVSVAFAPALGLLPLNLSGVSSWNSTAVASPSANWNLLWSWTENGFNGTTGSGSGSKSGSVSGTGTVNLTGFKVATTHGFLDHMTRVGVLLVISGPFDFRDGFVLVPHDFDLFGSAVHPYDSLEFGSAAVSSETLFLSSGTRGPAVTAADTTFGSSDTSMTTMATPTTGPTPATSSSPGATVQGQPMSVSEAQSIANTVTQGFGAVAKAALSGALVVGVIALGIVLLVGAVGVTEWRSYARRKSSSTGLVGGYATHWPNGVPPAAASPPSPEAALTPASSGAEEPVRRP